MIYALVVVIGANLVPSAIDFVVGTVTFETEAQCMAGKQIVIAAAHEKFAVAMGGYGICATRADLLRAFESEGLTAADFPSPMGDGVKGVPVPAVEPARLSGRTPGGTFA